MATPDDLTDLVDNPNEALAVEYKSGLNLSDNLSRAKFARHIAALANYGGGYLVLGFNDDLTRAVQTEFPAIDRDAVAGIVKSYLDPPFQCEVRIVTATRGGARHTIVAVPSHGHAPICARRDGPSDAKGHPQGISRGAYYVRKPGPASEQILTPLEWAPLIRRCALAERAEILGAIDVALRGGRVDDDIEPRLRHWHESLAQNYAQRLNAVGRREALRHGYMQFSFSVRQRGEAVAHEELMRVVERCNAQADSVTRLHWGPFVVLHREAVAPRSRIALDIDDGECEFLEAAVIEAATTTDAADLWRVSSEGMASLIKAWWEDTPNFRKTPKTCLSPNYLAKEVAGLVIFARAFANNFESTTAVTFRCEWTGLKGRQPFEHHGRWRGRGIIADDERRVSSETISLAEMNGGWEAPSAKIMGPVARAVGLGHVLTAEWLASQAASWALQQ